MITTVFGLLVGIPTLGAYYYFKRKVEIRVLEMEEVSLALIEDLAYDGAASSEAEEPEPVSRAVAAGERSR